MKQHCLVLFSWNKHNVNVHTFLTAGMVERMNSLTVNAYRDVFRSIFDTVRQDHPKFAVGKSLKGIITDWSATQRRGIEQSTSVEVASRVLKGCEVCLIHTYECQHVLMHNTHTRTGPFSKICQAGSRESQQGTLKGWIQSLHINCILHSTTGQGRGCHHAV